MKHRAGYINIIGHPNVGKSTLLNALLGEHLMITSPKAQTTRHRILGIWNDEGHQLVFSDTPGVILPAYALQEHMMEFVRSSFEDTDVFLYLTAPEDQPLQDQVMREKLGKTDRPVLLVLNKIDLLDPIRLEAARQFWQGEMPQAEFWPLSAKEGFGVEELRKRLLELVPESPPYFPKENLSDRNERFFCEEMIREQVLLNYDQEVPYACEVAVEEFKEHPDILRIRAIIHVERDSQKAIVVGKGGQMIKRTGTAARKRLEAFFDQKVFLDLQVKVRKNWRQNEGDLRRFGYRRS